MLMKMMIIFVSGIIFIERIFFAVGDTSGSEEIFKVPPMGVAPMTSNYMLSPHFTSPLHASWDIRPSQSPSTYLG